MENKTKIKNQFLYHSVWGERDGDGEDGRPCGLPHYHT